MLEYVWGRDRGSALETWEGGEGGRLLSRRQFVAAAGIGAAGLSLAGAARGEQLPVDDRVERLSVGFVEGSDAYSDLGWLPWRDPEPGRIEVTPAERMPLGDQTLANEAVTMIVHGLYPGFPPRRIASFTTVILTVYFPSPDPLRPQPLPFYSGGARRLPNRTKGARVRFPVGLRQDGGLEVVLEVYSQAPGTRLAAQAGRILRGGTRPGGQASALSVLRLYTDFTVDWYDGRPKLQRGTYLLGLAPGCWSSSTSLPGLGEPADHGLCSLAVSFEPPAFAQ
jgi:hypothetical protein